MRRRGEKGNPWKDQVMGRMMMGCKSGEDLYLILPELW